MALRTGAIKIAPGTAVLNSTVLVGEAAKQAASHLNNLNFLRFIAAGMVWYGHSFAIKQVPEPLFLGAVPIGPVGVWIFFAISGFLVYQSWIRDPRALAFLLRRSLRIFPGLMVCILLSAFVLGPMLTRLSMEEYFAHPSTWNYLKNIGLYINYTLPGVFENNPIPFAVNGSIWSLTIEFMLYLLMLAVVLLAALLSRNRVKTSVSRAEHARWWMLSCFVICCAASLLWAWPYPDLVVFYATDVRQVVLCGSYFFAGCVLASFNLTKWLSLSNVVLAFVLMLGLSINAKALQIGSWITIPIIALGFGLVSHPLGRLFAKHDYSYGIYIYAFPVQQAVVLLYPGLSMLGYLAVTGGVILLLAALSWHWVEQPFLRFKPAATLR